MRAIPLALILFATPAFAGWEVSTYKDRLTDRTETFVTVRAGDASLYVGCKNGQVFPELTFPRRVAYVEAGVSYRFDAGEVVPRIAAVSTDGREVWPWISAPGDAVSRLRGSKRLRVQIGGDVLDFDTTGAADALSKVKCR